MNDIEKELSSFIHALSHDMRNILHNIQGYADLLEDEHDPVFLEGISRSVKKAKRLMQEYVDIADAGNLTKRPSN
ncbi:MAG: histidine kinase dimerization/phospho-acceptor domain-containing protein [Candidatus Thorarchaeota archaeon]|nr:histidine kinase dimerization/phospho-acceptor domain-containing protein [Candidatus Thorarchaeota archaeon]